MRSDQRLAVYGSLGPGEANHDELDGLSGGWQPGTVRGWRLESGWGAATSYPGLRPDPAEPQVAVRLFTSPELPAHWAGSMRSRATRTSAWRSRSMRGRVVSAQIYALRPEP